MVRRKEPVDIINGRQLEEASMWIPQEELSINEVARSESGPESQKSRGRLYLDHGCRGCWFALEVLVFTLRMSSED